MFTCQNISQILEEYFIGPEVRGAKTKISDIHIKNIYTFSHLFILLTIFEQLLWEKVLVNNKRGPFQDPPFNLII